MKKITLFVCLLTAILLSPKLYAEDIENVIVDITKEKNVDNVRVGGFLMTCAKFFGAAKVGGKEGKLVKSINSVQAINFDCNDADKREHYISRMNKLKDDSEYETLIRVKDDGDNVYIALKKEKNKITGFYVMNIDDKSIAIVKILGKFKQEDIDSLINDYSKEDKNN